MDALKTSIMPGVFQTRKYRKVRISQAQRVALSRFYNALYSQTGDDELPAKPKSVQQAPIADAVPFTYLDAHGVEQTLDLLKVKNLGDTAYAESQKLFPNATPCMIDKDGVRFDDEGRENILNENLVILEARRMTVGDYGPWFLLRCAHPTRGEISVPAPGQIANGAVAQMSGIDLKTGEVSGVSELPVWARFSFIPDRGQFGNGYFIIEPAMEQLSESNPNDE